MLPESDLSKSTVHAQHGLVRKYVPNRKRLSEKVPALALSGAAEISDSDQDKMK